MEGILAYWFKGADLRVMQLWGLVVLVAAVWGVSRLKKPEK